jgi:small-conductance mechanosensitive channel
MMYAVIVVVEWKIPTGSLALVAGGLSAGIGIALKDIINNFIYGIQLMGGRLRVGDWIECDGIRGRVTAINYQCVQVETLEGTEMSFLNASLFGKNFNNLTRNNSYEFTKIIVGVAYGTDVKKVRQVLTQAMQQQRTKDHYGRDIVEPKKGIYVVVNNMSDSSVDIAVKQYVLVAERIGYIDRAKEVIYEALNDAGIAIPFPQCDVHLVNE